jgi:hypothetical protein
MTVGNARPVRQLRRISAADVGSGQPDQTPDQIDEVISSDEEGTGRKRPRDEQPRLARIVSHEAQYISENDENSLDDVKEKAPMFDVDVKNEPHIPAQPNPLHDSKLLETHVHALRLEAELFPMRQLVARLMAHATHNRRGLFNSPVDHVALGLTDYETIITRPRDLGTIKARLHAVSYNSREEVADDIRLVFVNAMTYSPPNNPVHIAARHLLQAFEEACQVMKATSNPSTLSDPRNSNSKSWSCIPTVPAPQHDVTRSVSMVDVMEPTACEPLHTSPRTVELMPLTVETVTNSSEEITAERNASAAVDRLCEPDVYAPANAQRQDTTSGPIVHPNPAVQVEGKCGLRGSYSSSQHLFAAPLQAEKALKRALNVAAKHAKHSCRSCLGRNCSICEQGCLSHEPALLICTGSNCLGAKIRKGAVYYIAKDGSRQFCQRCYTNLQAVLPHTADQIESFGSSVRYKRDLLKRKNEEDVAEAWLTCKSCNNGVHKICSMYNEFVHSNEDYECPSCIIESEKHASSLKRQSQRRESIAEVNDSSSDYYTCVSGSDTPAKLADVAVPASILSAESLPETPVSAFIQRRVRDCIAASNVPNAEKTVTVRVISDCSKSFKVPEVVRKHFRQPAPHSKDSGVVPPARVNYKSKAITLFQKIDGLDVCIFCMYVQEYNCDDDFEGDIDGEQKKRVYIAYLDSVEHFQPRACRTQVFREILVAYLATARARGYESAHIWACPPSRGNSFVFWNHPASQRTPTKERLIAWYHGVINRCVESGVVTDVQSLFESSFPLATGVRTSDAGIALSPENMTVLDEGVLDGRMACPPLMDGDFWIEEAVRLHATSIVRHLKSKPSPGESDTADERCPAVQVAILLRDRVMAQSSAAPFRRPVNAESLQLKDYHKIITRPMDLGTVYSRCILGEFDTLRDVVDDVELVFANAMRYNPKGHPVHDVAIEVRELFFKELDSLTKTWPTNPELHGCKAVLDWTCHAKTSTSLDTLLEDPADEELMVPARVSASDESTPKSTNPAMISNSPNPKGELRIQIPEDIMRGQESLPPPSDHCSPSTVTALLPNSGRKPASQSPTSLNRTENAMFALLNSKLELLTGGEDAILQKMVGNDIWIMDKKCPTTPKAVAGKKKAACKRRKGAGDSSHGDEPPAKRRRQCWLGEEVGLSVRKMRTSFFSCSLVPKANMSPEEASKENDFQAYIAPFFSSNTQDRALAPSRIADARHAFLEFSQYRNLEFDTLRRAKYSTSILLYHLHYDEAPGLIPTCSSCEKTIQEIRWHRIRRVEERHHTGRVPPTLRAARLAEIGVDPDTAEACHKGEELCADCYDKRSTKEEFIPLPVSFKA